MKYILIIPFCWVASTLIVFVLTGVVMVWLGREKEKINPKTMLPYVIALFGLLLYLIF